MSVLLLLLLLKNSQWDVCTEQSCSAKRNVWRLFPSLCCAERCSGLNRISHPDWMKLCVELNYAPNQNTKISSATNSKFSFFFIQSFPSLRSIAKVKEPSLSYYLPIVWGRIIGFIPFRKAFVLCKMQRTSSRIWTHIPVSICYDDNHCFEVIQDGVKLNSVH